MKAVIGATWLLCRARQARARIVVSATAEGLGCCGDDLVVGDVAE
jgi:hypothetical protein